MRRLATSGYLALVCALAMPLCCWFLPGISADGLIASALAGALLGGMHIVLRPILRLVTAPIGCITLGLFSFAIDVGLIYLASFMLGGFHVSGVTGPALAAVIINILCALVNRARGRK